MENQQPDEIKMDVNESQQPIVSNEVKDFGYLPTVLKK